MTDFELIISSDELAAGMSRPDWRIVDCRFYLLDPDRGHQEYLKGHIPGARYADLDKDLAGPITPDSGRHPLPQPEQFVATLGRLGINNDSQVVVYDDAGGAIAARLWWLLNWMGHRRVAVLDGGYQAWLEAHEVTPELPEVPSGNFVGTPDASMVVTTDDVLERMRADRALDLVDARDGPRFAGESEPIDTRAGHIPGALNYPFSENLDSNGRWRSGDDLHGKWTSLGYQCGKSCWAAMCGSGVTACHLVISARLAGLEAPALFVGSWSEWIRDPERPIATGPD